MDVLWIDDDSPLDSKVIGGTNVFTAQTLGAAERLIAEKKVHPDWVIVDLIIPQAGWHKDYLLTPGVEYIRHLASKYSNDFKLAVFSIALDDERVRRARAAGAQIVADKHSASLVDVLDQIREHSGNGNEVPGADTGGGDG